MAQRSRDFVLGVMFPESRAARFPATLAMCEGATQYWTVPLGSVTYHCAVFDPSPEQMARALAVVNNALSGMQFFARGLPLVDAFELHNTLKCFVQSLSCADKRAHCYSVVTRDRLEYLFPCKRITERSPSLPIDRAHPSHVFDQIQAKAVAMCCDWCPNFDATQFGELETPQRRLTKQAPVTLDSLSTDGEIDMPGDPEV